jgi:acetate---CoA ligase (ADP-forming)
MLATNADEAIYAAQIYGFPVVLKIQAADIQHKSDMGGVLLNVSNEDEVREGFYRIMRFTGTHSKAVDGILVSPMRPAGIELLVGILHDPLWGQVVAVGLGGIWAEVFNDTSVRVLPISRSEIRRMLAELRGAPLLLHGESIEAVDVLVTWKAGGKGSRGSNLFPPTPSSSQTKTPQA